MAYLYTPKNKKVIVCVLTCSLFLRTMLVEIAADVKMAPRNAREDGMMRRTTRSMEKVKDVGSK